MSAHLVSQDARHTVLNLTYVCYNILWASTIHSLLGGCGEKRLGISDIRCMSKSSQNVFLMDNLL